jgi:hypothetical protein
MKLLVALLDLFDQPHPQLVELPTQVDIIGKDIFETENPFRESPKLCLATVRHFAEGR